MSAFVPSIFRFTQTTPAATWTIAHNLGHNGSAGVPIVDAFVSVSGVLTKVIPQTTTMVDANTVTLTFSSAQSGFAVVVV